MAPEALSVIAHTTAMRYKGSRKNVSRIARELGVEYVVEGGVHRIEDKVVLNVQLVRASNQMYVFASRYQAELRDIFKMETSIARDIGEHIDSAHVVDAIWAAQAVNPPDRQPRTKNPAAYDAYRRARFSAGRGTPDVIANARHHFEEAIAHDAAFALAYDRLAEMYWYLSRVLRFHVT